MPERHNRRIIDVVRNHSANRGQLIIRAQISPGSHQWTPADQLAPRRADQPSGNHSFGRLLRPSWTGSGWSTAEELTTLPGLGYVSDLAAGPAGSRRMWLTSTLVDGPHVLRSDDTAAMRARVEWILAALLAAAAVATAVPPMWIETLFGAEPDGGSGETEWWIVVVLGLLALAVAALAGRTSIRGRSAPSASRIAPSRMT